VNVINKSSIEWEKQFIGVHEMLFVFK